MTDVPRLDAYHLYEREWDSYEQLRDAFEWELPERFNVAEYVCDRWADDRGRVALFAEDASGARETHTFWDLRNEANRLANFFESRDVGRGDRVGVNLPQVPETLVSLLAAWKLGAVPVPLSTLFGPEAMGFRLGDAEAAACVVHASNVGSLRAVRDDLDAMETVVTVGDVEPEAGETALEEATAGQSRQFETATTTPDDDGLLIYTSGTTGPPKGVRHGHRVLLGYLPGTVMTIFDMTMEAEDLVWAMPEWAWVGSLFGEVLPAMFFGVPQLAYHRGGPFDPEAAFELIERHAVTITFLPPTALRMMMQVDDPAGRYDLSSMRVIMSGGESVGDSLVAWAADVFDGAAIHEAYGQTEQNPLVGDCTALFPFKEGTMGRPRIGREVRIVDPETAEPTVATGEVGEIAVRHEGDPGGFKEYLDRPEATAEKVRDGWLLTEDLGSMDADGYVSFHGRKDDVIICAGHRIGPEEIEESLARHDAVAEAGVVGVPDETRGEVPVAFVVLAAGFEPSTELAGELQDYVKDTLAKYEYPRDVRFVEALPMTPTGKIKRYELRERYEAGEA